MNNALDMMTQTKVSALQKDDRFEGFLLVRSSDSRTGGNGNPYLDLTLSDASGDMNAKVWNTSQEAPKVGSVVKVRGSITEFNGRLQFRVEKLRVTTEEDEVDISQLVTSAPEKPESMMQTVYNALDGFKNENLRKVVRWMVDDVKDKLLFFPAAQRLHHAERSGLLHHTTNMLKVAEALLACYPQLDGDLLKAGVIVHDLGKTYEMASDEYGNVSDYTRDGLLLGHLVREAGRVRDAASATNVPLEDEYLLLLEHMILSHHGEAEYGSPRKPMFPEAELLHFIDVIDARMNEMEGILARIPEGVFSERVWSLDRRIYHPMYRKEP